MTDHFIFPACFCSCTKSAKINIFPTSCGVLFFVAVRRFSLYTDSFLQSFSLYHNLVYSDFKMNPNNLSQPSEMYGNSQSSGYESMPDYFYQDFPSQEMGPPPVPNRFQQQQPQMLTPQAPQSQQSMDHQSSQMGSNQGWHQSQQQPQQQPQQHFQQPQQQGEQEQQQPPQFQQPAAAPAPPPAQPQFRLQQQPSAPAPPKAQPATVTTQPQFVLNNQTATSSTSRSNTPIQVDKTRINVLRQQVLHPVDPKIVEKMHTSLCRII